jgi:hypothetical protein
MKVQARIAKRHERMAAGKPRSRPEGENLEEEEPDEGRANGKGNAEPESANGPQIKASKPTQLPVDTGLR